ncbi:hypothetical protein D3C79_745390 [compost metagenome]
MPSVHRHAIAPVLRWTGRVSNARPPAIVKPVTGLALPRPAGPVLRSTGRQTARHAKRCTTNRAIALGGRRTMRSTACDPPHALRRRPTVAAPARRSPSGRVHRVRRAIPSPGPVRPCTVVEGGVDEHEPKQVVAGPVAVCPWRRMVMPGRRAAGIPHTAEGRRSLRRGAGGGAGRPGAPDAVAR